MGGLHIWTIYKHPRDYPEQYVARCFINDQPTDAIVLGSSIEEVRSMLPQGLTCVARHDMDDPVIVECWL